MSEGDNLGPLADYIAAREAFIAADRVAEATSKALAAAARAISGDQNTVRSFNSNNENAAIKAIPDADRVMQIMIDWQTARNAVRAAYAALPADMSRHVVGLPRGAGP